MKASGKGAGRPLGALPIVAAEGLHEYPGAARDRGGTKRKPGSRRPRRRGR